MSDNFNTPKYFVYTDLLFEQKVIVIFGPNESHIIPIDSISSFLFNNEKVEITGLRDEEFWSLPIFETSFAFSDLNRIMLAAKRVTGEKKNG